ncbi:MAG TPA: hypothetical protein VFB62_23160 [Polyangiaceae bacterium]|nr:hypothetical protein [Polyangiaceae bacterium]
METWLEEIERAHADIQVALFVIEQHAEGDLSGAATALVAALGRVYDAVDGRADALSSVKVAENAMAVVAESVDDAEGALRAAAEASRRAAEHLNKVSELLARAPVPARRMTSEPVMASLDRPRLHRIARASLVPRLRLADPAQAAIEIAAPVIERPRSFEELDQLGTNIAAKVRASLEPVLTKLPKPSAAQDSSDKTHDDHFFIGKWARECLEEIGMTGLHRRPLLGDDWRGMLAFERRMLSAADAFASLGAPALSHLEAFVLDAPVVDPTRMFSAVFVAGCLDGRDALGIAERLARDAAANEDLLAAVTSAFKLAPHPSLPLALRTLAHDSDPALRALAVEVLAHRDLHERTLSDEELMAFAADRPEVACHALLPLTVRNHPEADATLTRALGSPRLRESAWTALFSKAPARATAALRAQLGESERAELFLALAGDSDDAKRLRERALREPTPWRAEALGWAGRIESIPALLELLAHADLELRVSAARALDRLTGAALVAAIAIPPERTVPRELPEPAMVAEEAPAPLAQLTSDPRFAPSEGSPDMIEGPVTEPEPWRAWWREHGSRFDRNRRYRRGAPHALAACLAELDGPDATPAERQLLHLELAGGSRRYVHFDVDDLVVVQEDALAKWRALVS